MHAQAREPPPNSGAALNSKPQLGAHAPSYTMSPFSGSLYEAVSVVGLFSKARAPNYAMDAYDNIAKRPAFGAPGQKGRG
jgi:hypothetical protein